MHRIAVLFAIASLTACSGGHAFLKGHTEAKGGEEKFLEVGIKPRIINLLRDGKEDAEFSKMLATIRVDALDSFDVASTEWLEHGQIEDILELFWIILMKMLSMGIIIVIM